MANQSWSAQAGMTADDFRAELDRVMAAAKELGVSAIELSSGALHRRVGGYPGASPRMPVCCTVMRNAMKPGDRVVSEPPSGQGAKLVIRYEIS